MTGYLLDTNVISMLSPSRAGESGAVQFLKWLARKDSEGQVFLSVVTVQEIEKGIALLDTKGATARASGLKLWLAGLFASYGDKIIGVDAATAALAGWLEAKAMSAGHDPGMADAIIAGIAQAHGLVIVTRNKRHFQPFGVCLMSPDDVALS